jgi:hypothetical protein
LTKSIVSTSSIASDSVDVEFASLSFLSSFVFGYNNDFFCVP